MPILTDEEIQTLERLHPDGLTAQEVVSVFTSRDTRVSEATFRKYVQLGLLPRSRRVRRAGWRGGSQGLYPVSVVRRILEIKELLAQEFTMDEIRSRFLCATSELDELEASLGRVFARLVKTVEGLSQSGEDVRQLRAELAEVRISAEELTRALRGMERSFEEQAREPEGVRKIV